MRIKYFPFLVVKRFNLRNEYLDKLADSEILEFMFKELKKEKYEKIQLTETTVEFKGDHSGLLKPLWVITQSIDFGTISIERRDDKRKMVFKYQSTIYPLINLIFGLAVSLLSKSLQIGIIAFLITFILFWNCVYLVQIVTVSVCLDKLEYKKRWKDK